MKKFDLGQTISILANLGVIAGIVFLGLELQQNNELLEAESRYALADRAVGLSMTVAENRNLALALAKLMDGDSLDTAEEIQLRSYALAIFRNFEANFDELQAGNLSEAGLLDAHRGLMRNQGVPAPVPWHDYWQLYRDRASPEFVYWMQERVFGENE